LKEQAAWVYYLCSLFLYHSVSRAVNVNGKHTLPSFDGVNVKGDFCCEMVTRVNVKGEHTLPLKFVV
jgi:hypothetical protein